MNHLMRRRVCFVSMAWACAALTAQVQAQQPQAGAPLHQTVRAKDGDGTAAVRTKASGHGPPDNASIDLGAGAVGVLSGLDLSSVISGWVVARPRNAADATRIHAEHPKTQDPGVEVVPNSDFIIVDMHQSSGLANSQVNAASIVAR